MTDAGFPREQVPEAPQQTPGEMPAAGAAASGRTPRGRGRRLLTGAAVVVAIAVGSGAAGYAIGDGSRSPVNPFRSFSFNFPGGGNSNFGFGHFGLPNGFGQLPGSGAPTTTPSAAIRVPAAVRRAERGLVDIQVVFSGSGSGAGTGIVLSSDGVVLTNNHVIDGASTIRVTDLGNSQTYNATVLGYDVAADVAVLKLSGASGLATSSFSTAPSLGEAVYAVGNAGGTGGTPTATSGSLTKLDASVSASDDANGTSELLHHMLATDAQVIPGDSGGALMTSTGKVLGMDTAGGTGGGFAVPAARALAIASEIEAGTSTTSIHVGPTPILGIEVSTTDSVARVVAVLPGSPAASVGITAGSTITAVGAATVSSPDSLRQAVLSLRVGEAVTVKWLTAAGDHESGSLVLASGPAQ